MRCNWIWALLVLLFLVSCAGTRKNKDNLSAKDKQLLEKYSQLTGASVENKDLSLYRFIENWWGVPHKIGGIDSNGVDCSGFMFRLYDEVYGKKVARTTDGLFKQSERCDTAQLVTGDLVFIVFQGREKISHVGIYLQHGRFAHASTSKGVRIDYMRDTYYKKQQFIGGKLP